MSKFDEVIAKSLELVEKTGVSVNEDLLRAVSKGLGPSIYKADAATVSSSDEKELETVKKNFLIKKLGLEDSPALDEAIAEVVEALGKSTKNKMRTVFYTLLVQKFGKEDLYELTPAKKETTKEKIKEETVVEETPAAEATNLVAETPAVEEVKEEAAPVAEKVEETPAATETAVEEATEEKKVTAPVFEEDTTAHDDFDWSIDKRNVAAYDMARIAEMEEEYTRTLTTLAENEIVSGTVVSITSSDVVLNVGFKSDGMVGLSEFRDIEDLKVGDEVEVYVVTTEDAKGQLELSRRKAKLLKAWENIKSAHLQDEVVKGTVLTKTKGGLIVDVHGLETFLPGSQIDVKPIIDYDSYVGKTMEFKVVKINEQIKNAVVSHKALIESDIEEQRMEIISQLEKGQVLEGTIKNITDFGAFIDLGGVDGLLYITDISWGRINHPSEVLELNQKINVVVLEFDDNKKRISLGLKQLTAHPWDNLSEEVEVGKTIKGKIVNVEDYGAFLEIQPGIEGLIHVSEVAWSNEPINSREFFTMGQEFDAVVMTLDREDRKMSLSLKQLTPDPWGEIAKKYPVGEKTSGEVKNITPYGVFIELEEGIGGMIHISDLSWTKRYAHPSEFTKVGENLEVIVLDIDDDSRKLSLGHKQIEEDPWDTFESVFPEGSVHEATVLSHEDKGAIVLLPYGLEAFAPNRHLKKEDGSKVAVDEKLDFKVLEFNRNDKRIIVSHSKVNDDNAYAEKEQKSKDRKANNERTSKAVKNLNSKVEASTLGDLDVLAELKKKMEGEGN